MSYSTKRPSAVGQYLSMAPPLKMAGNLEKNKKEKRNYQTFDKVYFFYFLLTTCGLCLINRKYLQE